MREREREGVCRECFPQLTDVRPKCTRFLHQALRWENSLNMCSIGSFSQVNPGAKRLVHFRTKSRMLSTQSSEE